MDEKARYYAQLKRLQEGDAQLPLNLQSLTDDAAYSRINRVSLSKGFVTVWWDDPEIQNHLAEAFRPTTVKRHTDIPQDDTPAGRMYTRLGKSLDDGKTYLYPDISNVERTFHSVVKIHCVAASIKKEKFSELVRVLSKQEKKQLLLLNDLPHNADALKINTGLDRLPA